MTVETKNNNQPILNPDVCQEASQEGDQVIIDALERYLRQASLAQAYPLPRWVMW